MEGEGGEILLFGRNNLEFVEDDQEERVLVGVALVVDVDLEIIVLIYLTELDLLRVGHNQRLCIQLHNHYDDLRRSRFLGRYFRRCKVELQVGVGLENLRLEGLLKGGLVEDNDLRLDIPAGSSSIYQVTTTPLFLNLIRSLFEI